MTMMAVVFQNGDRMTALIVGTSIIDCSNSGSE